MKKLQIAPGLQLPLEAVTQTFGILAKRGAGKSNAAAVMAEAMYDADLPFVVVDPVGAWWGLRSSRDGKSEGLAIPIFGGYRGDVPLEPTAGKLIADVVVDERLSCVLDVSAFESEGAKRRFLADFAERLFRRKGQPGNEDPLHLFLEEADDYAPQKGGGVEINGTLGAFQRMVKQGRARGLGSTMITQRSAVLNKDLLTQIETLVVLRTTSPQDRKAIEGWVTYHGLAEEILASLHELKDGEAWVWSPWLNLVERIRFPRRRTFDSGSTPAAKGGGRRVARLADVDLTVIETQMKETLERAKKEDPRELQRRVAELEKELKARPHVEPEVVTQTVHIIGSEELEQLKGMVDQIGRILDATTREMEQTVGKIAEQIWGVIDEVHGRLKMQAAGKVPRPLAPPPREKPRPAERSTRRTETPAASAVGDLSAPEQRILDAIAWWNEVGFEQPTKLQVAFIAKYRVGKRVGGTFGNLLGSLRSNGLIDYPTQGRVELTDAGRAVATSADIPATIEGLQEAVYERLDGPERRVLRVLIEAYPAALPKQEIGERAGYTVGDRVGGTFGNILGRLRSLGLIEYPTPGAAAAEPVLFLA